MSGTQPVMLYGLKVPPGDILVAGTQELPAMFRVTMAAIDPTEEPEEDADANGTKPLRSTLKIVRIGGFEDQFSSDEDDEDDDEHELHEDDEDEKSSDKEETNGGPSDPERVKKAQEASAMKSSSEEDESDDEDGPVDIKAALKRIAKGKAPATDDENGSEDEDIEMEEFVVCTLDPEKQYQQPLDIVCNEHESLFFKVTGTHAVYLTGNYLTPVSPDKDESYQPDEIEDEYDLSPDEDELDLLDEGDEDESDELDDLEDPRITEVDSDDEMDEAPKLIEQAKGKVKGKNKRPAEESEDETLDDLIAKTINPEEPLTNGSAKLSKKERKKLKKLNNGVAAPVVPAKEDTKNPTSSPVKSDKKVQFAEKLEQGPTNSKKKEDKKADKKVDKKVTEPKSTVQEKAKPSVKVVQGVTVDDRKIGEGAGAKKGDRLEMRYIGKLENGKIFDANKGGKPFGLKLGAGEVIKGWDIGLVGMAIGGERRLTIPPNLAYGSKSQSGIPSNSTLIFDVKLLNIK